MGNGMLLAIGGLMCCEVARWGQPLHFDMVLKWYGRATICISSVWLTVVAVREALQ